MSKLIGLVFVVVLVSLVGCATQQPPVEQNHAYKGERGEG